MEMKKMVEKHICKNCDFEYELIVDGSICPRCDYLDLDIAERENAGDTFDYGDFLLESLSFPHDLKKDLKKRKNKYAKSGVM